MYQTQSPMAGAFFDGGAPRIDQSQIISLLKSRLLHFVIPYIVVLIAGMAVIEWQPSIYRSEGKILVESPEIPPDLVRPTITEVAYERVQVIQQRIMARDNLMSVINKFGLFPRERETFSGTELLELIRSRTDIKPVELSAQATMRQVAPTIAFTLGFEYEDPRMAMTVANEFLTSILREDASARNKDAAGTALFLEREVKRLENEYDAVVAQIVAARKRPTGTPRRPPQPERTSVESDDVKLQKRTLSALEAELAQKSSIYSDEHPVLKNLRRNIASVKQMIASAPKEPAPEGGASNDLRGSVVDDETGERRQGIDADTIILTRQEANLQKSIEEAHRKLTAARLGETMERNQQGERLRVIEQPSLPQKPVRPKKLKWLATVFGLSVLAGAAAIFLAETIDGTIRSSRDLLPFVDRGLLVSIPRLSSELEDRRERRRIFLAGASVCVVSLAALSIILLSQFSLDIAWIARPIVDSLSAGK